MKIIQSFYSYFRNLSTCTWLLQPQKFSLACATPSRSNHLQSLFLLTHARSWAVHRLPLRHVSCHLISYLSISSLHSDWICWVFLQGLTEADAFYWRNHFHWKSSTFPNIPGACFPWNSDFILDCSRFFCEVSPFWLRMSIFLDYNCF